MIDNWYVCYDWSEPNLMIDMCAPTEPSTLKNCYKEWSEFWWGIEEMSLELYLIT